MQVVTTAYYEYLEGMPHTCDLKSFIWPHFPGPVQFAGPWEQDCSFSTRFESESCLPTPTAMKRSPSKFWPAVAVRQKLVQPRGHMHHELWHSNGY